MIGETDLSVTRSSLSQRMLIIILLGKNAKLNTSSFACFFHSTPENILKGFFLKVITAPNTEEWERIVSMRILETRPKKSLNSHLPEKRMNTNSIYVPNSRKVQKLIDMFPFKVMVKRMGTSNSIGKKLFKMPL